jgi:hypothetical protein
MCYSKASATLKMGDGTTLWANLAPMLQGTVSGGVYNCAVPLPRTVGATATIDLSDISPTSPAPVPNSILVDDSGVLARVTSVGATALNATVILVSESSQIVTAWGNPTSDEKIPSEKLTKDTLDTKVNIIDHSFHDDTHPVTTILEKDGTWVHSKSQDEDAFFYTESIINYNSILIRSREHDSLWNLQAETVFGLMKLTDYGETQYKWYYALANGDATFNPGREVAVVSDVGAVRDEVQAEEARATIAEEGKVNIIPAQPTITFPPVTGAGNEFNITVPAGRVLAFDQSNLPVIEWTGTTPHPISFIGIRLGNLDDDYYGVWSTNRYDENDWTLGRFRVYRDGNGQVINVVGTIDVLHNLDQTWYDTEYLVRNALHGNVVIEGDMVTVTWNNTTTVKPFSVVTDLATTRLELLDYVSELDETKASREVVIRQRYQTVRVNGVNETSDPAPVVDGGQLTLYLDTGTPPSNMRRGWNEDGSQLNYDQAVDRNVGEVLFVNDDNKIIGVGKKLGITPADTPSSTPATMSVMCTVFAEQDAVDDVQVDGVSVVSNKVANIVDKANKIAAKPDIAWGTDPMTVPAGRVLNLDTTKEVSFLAGSPVSYYAYEGDQPGYYFGVWTAGDGHSHLGQFRLNGGVPEVVSDVYNDVDGWISNQYLMVYGITNKTHVDIGSMPDGSFDFLTDITVRSEGKKDLADVEAEITVGLSELSLKKLGREEAAKIYDTITDVDQKIANIQQETFPILPAFKDVEFDGVVNFGGTIPETGKYAVITAVSPTQVTEYTDDVAGTAADAKNLDGVIVKKGDDLEEWYIVNDRWELLSASLQDYYRKEETDAKIEAAVSPKQDKSPNDNKIYALNNAGLLELPPDIGDRTAIVTEQSGTVTVVGDVLTIDPDFYAANTIFDLTWDGAQLYWNKNDDGATMSQWFEDTDGKLKAAKFTFDSTAGTVTRSLHADVQTNSLYLTQLHALTTNGVIDLYNTLDAQTNDIVNVGGLTVDRISADTTTSIAINSDLALGGTHKIMGLAAPTLDGDAANKYYVDNAGGGKKYARIVIGSTGAGYTAKDVDYLCDGTNDWDQFTAAVTAIPAEGGEIKILEGTYLLAHPWVIQKNNVEVTGSGMTNTILRMMGERSTTDDSNAAAKNTNSVIYLSGYACAIKSLTLALSEEETSGFSYGIYLVGGQNTITGNQISNMSINDASYGIRFAGAAENIITDNLIFNLTNGSGPVYGIYMETATDNMVLNNKIGSRTSNASIYGAYLTSSSNNNIFDGNVFTCSSQTGGSYGFSILSTCTLNIITNNVFKNSTASNGSTNGVSLSGQSNDNKISGNQFYNKSTNGSSYSININNCNNLIIANNYIANSNTGNVCTGIYAYQSSDNIISGNMVFNTTTNTATSYGIYGYYLNRSSIANNIIKSVANGGKIMGLYMNYCVANTIDSNVFAGKTATFSGFAFQIVGSANTYNRITNNNYRNWVEYGTGILTVNGSTVVGMPGGAISIERYSTSNGNTIGFNVGSSTLQTTSLTISGGDLPSALLGIEKNLAAKTTITVSSNVTAALNVMGFYSTNGSGALSFIFSSYTFDGWTIGDCSCEISLEDSTFSGGSMQVENSREVFIGNAFTLASGLTLNNNSYVRLGCRAAGTSGANITLGAVTLDNGSVLEIGSRVNKVSITSISGNGTLRINNGYTGTLTITNKTTGSVNIDDQRTLTDGYERFSNERWVTTGNVYKKIVSLGALPNNSQSFANLDIPNDTYQIIKFEAISWESTASTGRIMMLPFPSLTTNGSVELWITKNGTSYAANIKTAATGWSTYDNTYITVYYVKK